jgi:hypothetical protein
VLDGPLRSCIPPLHRRWCPPFPRQVNIINSKLNTRNTDIVYSIASLAIWLVITTVLWGVAAGLYMNVRSGGMCSGEPIISACRKMQTVEALAWTEMGLCILTLLAACFWVNRSKRSYVRLRFLQYYILDLLTPTAAKPLLRLSVHDLRKPNVSAFPAIIPYVYIVKSNF